MGACADYRRPSSGGALGGNGARSRAPSHCPTQAAAPAQQFPHAPTDALVVTLAAALGLVPGEAMSLVVAGALLSIALNPALFSLVEPVRNWILARSALARRLEARDDPPAKLPQDTGQQHLAGHMVLIDYGEASHRLAEMLVKAGLPAVAIEREREAVELLREQGRELFSATPRRPPHSCRPTWPVPPCSCCGAWTAPRRALCWRKLGYSTPVCASSPWPRARRRRTGFKSRGSMRLSRCLRRWQEYCGRPSLRSVQRLRERASGGWMPGRKGLDGRQSRHSHSVIN